MKATDLPEPSPSEQLQALAPVQQAPLALTTTTNNTTRPQLQQSQSPVPTNLISTTITTNRSTTNSPAVSSNQAANIGQMPTTTTSTLDMESTPTTTVTTVTATVIQPTMSNSNSSNQSTVASNSLPQGNLPTLQSQQIQQTVVGQAKATTIPIITNPNMTTTSQMASVTTINNTPTTTPPISHNQATHTKVVARGLSPATTTQPQPIALATSTAPTSTGPTALVIIPQHCAVTGSLATKPNLAGGKLTPITTATIGVSQPHLSIPVNAQTKSVQLTTIVPTANSTSNVPISAHQQSSTTSTIIQQQPQQRLAPTTTLTSSRPPSTLPIVPITSTPTATPVKTEQFKHTCSILDNGIKCDKPAGNASFSARIQKIVASKKMNYVLDPSAGHSYICEHHKTIFTAAKKSATMSNSKSARDYRHNNMNSKNTANNINPQLNSNINNDLASRPTLQHPINLEMLGNQNILVNNHGHPGIMNNQVLIRPGPNQVAYAHYQAAPVHPNQVTNMEVMMSSNFDLAGGDSLATHRGPGPVPMAASSGGVDVDLQQLQVNTLRRYKRHFRVPTRPGLNKMQLAESLKSHFKSLPIIEKEAITYFVYIVKCYRNKLDHNPKAD